MAVKQLKKLFLTATTSLDEIVRAINVIQENVAQSLNPLAAKVQNDSTIITNVSLKANQLNSINHTLGRQLLGYNVMLNVNGTLAPPAAIIANNQSNNPSPQLTLWLYTSSDCVVSLEVY